MAKAEEVTQAMKSVQGHAVRMYPFYCSYKFKVINGKSLNTLQKGNKTTGRLVRELCLKTILILLSCLYILYFAGIHPYLHPYRSSNYCANYFYLLETCNFYVIFNKWIEIPIILSSRISPLIA